MPSLESRKPLMQRAEDSKRVISSPAEARISWYAASPNLIIVHSQDSTEEQHTTMQLTEAQLAAATAVDSAKAVKEFACYDSSTTIGSLPVLNLARVCTPAGASIEGEDRAGMFAMALPLVTVLGVGTAMEVTDFFRSADVQEKGATGSLAAKQVIGARAFMGEIIDLMREHVKETAGCIVLPAAPSSGKAPARRVGAAAPAPTPAPAPAPAASVPATTPVLPTTGAAAAPAPAAALADKSGSVSAAAAAAAAASASISTTAQQQKAANHKVMLATNAEYMALLNSTEFDQEENLFCVSSSPLAAATAFVPQ
ncbi:unnamed protein product [Ectocarpus sp. CCAP 1310/34]|nr:unnamed protein product [Ectocarpus sp. CCAP 1310/34]